MIECEHLTGNDWCNIFEATMPEAMCGHCQGDGTGLFRAALEATRAKRDLKKRLKAGGEPFVCYRFGGVEVDAEFCGVCRLNPVLRQKLSSCRKAGLRLLNQCVHQGEWLRIEEVHCCGGKTKEVDVYACAKGHRAMKYGCLVCPDYRWSTPPEDVVVEADWCVKQVS